MALLPALLVLLVLVAARDTGAGPVGMAGAAQQKLVEAAQFLLDPGVARTPKEMQLGYMRDRLGLTPDQIVEAQRIADGFALQQTQLRMQEQQEAQDQEERGRRFQQGQQVL